MPKVQQYGPSRVRTQVTRGARASGAVPAEAFAPLGGAVEGIAQGVALFTKLKQRTDTTAAEEAMVNFERDKNSLFFDPDQGYFNTRGRNAYDQADSVNKSLDELKKKYIDSLDSDNAKNLFSKTADTHMLRAQQDIMRHASKGLDAWEIATLGAQAENAMENGALYWNDPKELKIQAAVGEQAIIDSATFRGIDSEALNEELQNFRSVFSRNAIEAATNSSSAEGQELLDGLMGKRLEGPDRIRVEKTIAAKQKAETTAKNSQFALSYATSVVDQFDTKTEMINQANEDIDDLQIRKQTTAEINRLWNQKNERKNEVEKDNYYLGIDHITAGGTVESFKATNPEAWEGMNAAQRNKIAKGAFTIGNPKLVNELLSLPPAELAKVDPNKYSSELSKSELNKLSGEVRQAQSGVIPQGTRSLARKSLDVAESFFGDRKDWKGAKEKGANELLTQIDELIAAETDKKKDKLTPLEINDILDNYTRELRVQKKGLFGIDFLARDVEITIDNAKPNELKAANDVIDQFGRSDEMIENIDAALEHMRDNNIPVSTDTLLLMLQQGGAI